MGLIRAIFIETIKRTSTITSFRFLPGKKISFIPGQFCQVIFDEENHNNTALNKYLSLSASPQRPYVEVTKRLSESDFSCRLKDLRKGDAVWFRIPLGGCVFREEDKRIGFLAGGIGITPVVSILAHIIDKGLNNDVILYYSNRSEGDIAFKKEIDAWRGINGNFKVIYTVTDCKPKDPHCVFGRIEKKLLLEKTNDYSGRIIFIFGPPKMVDAMRAICSGVGCVPDNLRVEKFTGY